MKIRVTKTAREMLPELIEKRDAWLATIRAFEETPPETPEQARELNQWQDIRRAEFTSAACRFLREVEQ